MWLYTGNTVPLERSSLHNNIGFVALQENKSQVCNENHRMESVQHRITIDYVNENTFIVTLPTVLVSSCLCTLHILTVATVVTVPELSCWAWHSAL